MLTMKTRLQLEEGKNLGIGQLIKQTLEHEGIAGMYRGLSSKLIQTISNTAILMAIHEKLSLIIVRLLSPPARQLS